VRGAAADGGPNHAGDDVIFTTGSGGSAGSGGLTGSTDPRAVVGSGEPGGPGPAHVRAGNGGASTADSTACDGGNVKGTVGEVGSFGTPKSKVPSGSRADVDAGGQGGPGTIPGAPSGGVGGDVELDGGQALQLFVLDIRSTSS